MANQEPKSYQKAKVHQQPSEESTALLDDAAIQPRSDRRCAPWWVLGLIALLLLVSGLVVTWKAPLKSTARDLDEPVSGLSADTETTFVRISITLRDLKAKIDGDVYFENDSGFDDAATVWVVGVQPPMVVIEPAHERDVQIVVPTLANLFLTYKFPFCIRSGGHHKAGYSTIAGGAVLSLVRLNHVKLKEEETDTAIATLGPAVTVDRFMDKIMVPFGFGGVIGFCGSVAEAGFVMGGGIGMQSRLYGLGLDNVQSFRIVLANGSVHKVSASHNEDLFWALRGAGGGNFGVVTEMDYRVHKTSDTVYYWPISLMPSDMATFLYQVGVRESELPGNLLLMVDLIANRGSGRIDGGFLWSGKTDEEAAKGELFLEDLVDSLLPQRSLNVSWSKSLWTDMRNFNVTTNNVDSDVPSWGDHVFAAQTWTGFLYPENNTEAIWKDIMHHISIGIAECPHLLPDIEFWGGAIHDTKWNETAFPHRATIWNVGVLLMIPEDLPNASEVYRQEAALVNAWWPNVAKHLSGSYLNYPMITLGDEYPRFFWGDNLPRLVETKQRYDPDNIFQFPLSIPLSL